jgi:preprotein translocase subunit SecE
VSKNPIEWADQSRAFLGEVQVEFKKVTWPSQKETVAGTVGVIVLVTIVGIALFVVDWLLSVGMSLIWP